MKPNTTAPFNLGPSLGYHAIAILEHWLPRPVFRFLLHIGVWIGLACKPESRRASRDYLTAVRGHPPTRRDLHRHFLAFMDNLIRTLQASRGIFPNFEFALDAEAKAFVDLCNSDRPALFGTFHVGAYDMMGCMLRQHGRRIHMIRQQVPNSHEIKIILRAFDNQIDFIWINDPCEFVIRLKETLQGGGTVGLQCDRLNSAAKRANFRFLGKQRPFPVTIYHLAFLFRCPVVFAFAGERGSDGVIEAYTSPVFEPGADRDETLERGLRHFQDVLSVLEGRLRRCPTLWFNFLPLECAE